MQQPGEVQQHFACYCFAKESHITINSYLYTALHSNIFICNVSGYFVITRQWIDYFIYLGNERSIKPIMVFETFLYIPILGVT